MMHNTKMDLITPCTHHVLIRRDTCTQELWRSRNFPQKISTWSKWLYW